MKEGDFDRHIEALLCRKTKVVSLGFTPLWSTPRLTFLLTLCSLANISLINNTPLKSRIIYFRIREHVYKVSNRT